MSPASPVYENLVTIHIDLGKDFKYLVDQEMENELAVAQQKWGREPERRGLRQGSLSYQEATAQRSVRQR